MNNFRDIERDAREYFFGFSGVWAFGTKEDKETGTYFIVRTQYTNAMKVIPKEYEGYTVKIIIEYPSENDA